MLCDKCKKNEATIQVTRNINGEVSEMNLCAECSGVAALGANYADNAVFDNLVKNFMNSIMGLGGNQQSQPTTEQLRCPTCGLTYDDFKNGGRLGCADCYPAFRSRLTTLFRSMNGSAVHVGKSPARGGAAIMRTKEIDDLRSVLRQLVESEDFEEAAKVRDRIKELTTA